MACGRGKGGGGRGKHRTTAVGAGPGPPFLTAVAVAPCASARGRLPLWHEGAVAAPRAHRNGGVPCPSRSGTVSSRPRPRTLRRRDFESQLQFRRRQRIRGSRVLVPAARAAAPCLTGRRSPPPLSPPRHAQLHPLPLTQGELLHGCQGHQAGWMPASNSDKAIPKSA